GRAVARARSRRFPFLHAEPRRTDLCDLPCPRRAAARRAGDRRRSHAMSACDRAHGHAAGGHGAGATRGPGRSDVQAATAPYVVEPVDEAARAARIRKLRELLETRIVFLDGAMGTM